MSTLLDTLGLADPTDGFALRVVTAKVVSTSHDVALLRVRRVDGSTFDAIMPVTEFYPDKTWQVDDVYQLQQLTDVPRPMLSATRPELVAALFEGVSPEVRSGAVRIMGVARLPGVRAKVAVAATEEGVDPIAACVGREANRVKAVAAALQGERLDIVAWHPDTETYLCNALAPAEVDRVEVDGGNATAFAPTHQMPTAVGGGGLNSSLAGQLVGLHVTISPS